MKKIAFFNQKRGLTPLKKCNFGTFKTFCFYCQKNVSCFSTKLLTIFSSLILTKSKWRKIWHFLTKSMGKLRFLDFEKFCFYTQKTVSFPSRTLLNLISSLVLTKNNKEKIGIFWSVAWVNPFGKIPFLGLWKISFLHSKNSFFSI